MTWSDHRCIKQLGVPNWVIAFHFSKHLGLVRHPVIKVASFVAHDIQPAIKRRSIQKRIARRGIERNDRLGPDRWAIERTPTWLAAFGKLPIRFEQNIQIHLTLLNLTYSVICVRLLPQFCWQL